MRTRAEQAACINRRRRLQPAPCLQAQARSHPSSSHQLVQVRDAIAGPPSEYVPFAHGKQEAVA